MEGFLFLIAWLFFMLTVLACLLNEIRYNRPPKPNIELALNRCTQLEAKQHQLKAELDSQKRMVQLLLKKMNSKQKTKVDDG